MKYRQGSIILVPFPFTDLPTTKKRPVLVLSKDEDNEHSDDLITCAITSKYRDNEYVVRIDESNLEEGELPIKSTILISKLFTIEKSLIIREFGKVNEVTLNHVKNIFQDLM